MTWGSKDILGLVENANETLFKPLNHPISRLWLMNHSINKHIQMRFPQEGK